MSGSEGVTGSSGTAWSDRFEQGLHPVIERFNASIEFDIALLQQDLDGSVAHARMLARVGVLTDAEFARLTAEGEERHATYVKLVKPIVDWDAPYSVVGEARMWVGFLTAIAANGFTAMKKALVSGQYRCARCCFYGGASLSASHACNRSNHRR